MPIFGARVRNRGWTCLFPNARLPLVVRVISSQTDLAPCKAGASFWHRLHPLFSKMLAGTPMCRCAERRAVIVEAFASARSGGVDSSKILKGAGFVLSSLVADSFQAVRLLKARASLRR